MLNIDLAKNRYSWVFSRYTDLFFDWTSICPYGAIGTHTTNTVNPMRHFPSNLFFHAALKILSSNIDRFGQKAIPPYFTLIELFLLKQHRNTHMHPYSKHALFYVNKYLFTEYTTLFLNLCFSKLITRICPMLPKLAHFHQRLNNCLILTYTCINIDISI